MTCGCGYGWSKDCDIHYLDFPCGCGVWHNHKKWMKENNIMVAVLAGNYQIFVDWCYAQLSYNPVEANEAGYIYIYNFRSLLGRKFDSYIELEGFKDRQDSLEILNILIVRLKSKTINKIPTTLSPNEVIAMFDFLNF